MKTKWKCCQSAIKNLIICFLLFSSLDSSAQRKIATIRLNGETLKKKNIVNSLAEWMSGSDLKKADSCIQVIFNAVNKKDTIGGRNGLKGLETVIMSAPASMSVDDGKPPSKLEKLAKEILAKIKEALKEQ